MIDPEEDINLKSKVKTKVKDTRKIKIEGKIITKNDLKKISKILEDELEKSNKKGNLTEIKYNFSFSDDTYREINSEIIFNDNEILDLKKTKKLQFEYWDFSEKKHVDFEARHGNYGDTEIIIVGEDLEWTSYIFSLFEDVINSIKPQENFMIKYANILEIATSIIFGYYIFSLLLPIYEILFDALGLTNYKGADKLISLLRTNIYLSKFILSILYIFSFYLIGGGFAHILYKWILDLWPSIEFDFGPEHLKKEKEVRKRIGILITLIVVPIIINLLF